IGSQTFQGNVTLTGDTMLTGTSGSFANGLDGDGHSLTLNYFNTTTIDGNSVFSDLNDLTSHGPVELGGTVQTAGNQSYLGTATLIGATEIQAAGGSFEGGLVGAGNDLTLNIASTITIEDGSGVNNLMSIGDTILTGTINTTGSQTYQSDVTIEGDVIIDAGGEVHFEDNVIGSPELAYSGWATQIGGTWNEVGESVAILPDGSFITTGRFAGTATFESDNLSLTSAGKQDVFVSKLTSDGEVVWTSREGKNVYDSGQSISAIPDNTGNVLIAGYVNTPLIGNNPPTDGLGEEDIAIGRLDSQGNFLWKRYAGGSLNDKAYSIAALPDGSSITTGSFSGVATFGNHSLTSDGPEDIFITKLSSTGDFLWAKRAGGPSPDRNADVGLSVDVLGDGSSIITGHFKETASFGELPPLVVSQGTGSDIFVAKLDPDGNFLWATQAGKADADMGQSVSVLADGSSIVTGSFRSKATFGDTIELTSEGDFDIFVAKINSDGVYEWATQAGGPDSDYGLSVSALENGSSIISGKFKDEAAFGDTIAITSEGNYDIFVAKIDSDGEFEWATSTGGPNKDIGSSVSVLGNGSATVTGSFQDTVAFGSSTLTSKGNDDGFVAKIDANGSFDGSSVLDDPDLTINTQADTIFGGTVSDLATLTTDAGGSTIAKADITTTGNQTYNDEFVLNTSLTLTGGNASFTSGIYGDGNDLTLNFTGNATLDGGSTTISG
ncbi:MAG: hypothetical protein GY732_00805, partial [Gammaproteobacteria bacterium]|nr:hypothetical protein [Gammaproteobacteria bacterium]